LSLFHHRPHGSQIVGIDSIRQSTPDFIHYETRHLQGGLVNRFQGFILPFTVGCALNLFQGGISGGLTRCEVER